MNSIDEELIEQINAQHKKKENYDSVLDNKYIEYIFNLHDLPNLKKNTGDKMHDLIINKQVVVFRRYDDIFGSDDCIYIPIGEDSDTLRNLFLKSGLQNKDIIYLTIHDTDYVLATLSFSLPDRDFDEELHFKDFYEYVIDKIETIIKGYVDIYKLIALNYTSRQ